jgi:hypothetical protein
VSTDEKQSLLTKASYIECCEAGCHCGRSTPCFTAAAQRFDEGVFVNA